MNGEILNPRKPWKVRAIVGGDLLAECVTIEGARLEAALAECDACVQFTLSDGATKAEPSAFDFFAGLRQVNQAAAVLRAFERERDA